MIHRSNYTRCRKPLRAFTLVELLVVIAIIAVLLSMLMPSLQRSRAQAKQINCIANMRQMGLALHMYAEDYNGRVVQTMKYGVPIDITRNTWHSNLTPYLDTSKKMTKVSSLPSVADAEMYSSIWQYGKLFCPAEMKPKTQWPNTQGIRFITYGIHVGWETYPEYKLGYGVVNADTGVTRKLADVRSSTIVFCDTRNVEYFYSTFYRNMILFGYGADDYIPARHPLGYCGTFADGHGRTIRKEVIQKDRNNPIWKAN